MNNINPVIKKIIDNAYENKKFSHVYIFSSSSSNYPTHEVDYLISQIIKSSNSKEIDFSVPKKYIDLYTVDGSKENIKKEQVISAIAKMGEKAFYKDAPKILLIKNIENANIQSLNTLLKFLEEPTNDSFIIMTTDNISSVIPTIKSRSQILTINTYKRSALINELKEKGYSEKEAFIISDISSSLEEGLKIKKEKIEDSISKLLPVLDNGISDSKSFFIALEKYIKKGDYLVPMAVIRTFFNDIWRHEISARIEISENSSLEKYALSNFDYASAITYINEFMSNRNKNINFDLDKNNMLIKLKELYV